MIELRLMRRDSTIDQTNKLEIDYLLLIIKYINVIETFELNARIVFVLTFLGPVRKTIDAENKSAPSWEVYNFDYHGVKSWETSGPHHCGNFYASCVSYNGVRWGTVRHAKRERRHQSHRDHQIQWMNFQGHRLQLQLCIYFNSTKLR